MQAGCLRDRSRIDERLDHNATSLLPGQRYTADQQCKNKVMCFYGDEVEYNINYYSIQRYVEVRT